jgi:type IV secretory pathway VirB3-like protein
MILIFLIILILCLILRISPENEKNIYSIDLNMLENNCKRCTGWARIRYVGGITF